MLRRGVALVVWAHALLLCGGNDSSVLAFSPPSTSILRVADTRSMNRGSSPPPALSHHARPVRSTPTQQGSSSSGPLTVVHSAAVVNWAAAALVAATIRERDHEGGRDSVHVSDPRFASMPDASYLQDECSHESTVDSHAGSVVRRSAEVDVVETDENIGRVTRVKVLPEEWTEQTRELFLQEFCDTIRAEAEAGHFFAGLYDIRDMKLPGPRECWRAVRQLVRGLEDVADPIDTRVHSVAVLVNPPTSIPSRLLRSCVETVLKLGAPPMSPRILDGPACEENARLFLAERSRLFKAGELHITPDATTQKPESAHGSAEGSGAAGSAKGSSRRGKRAHMQKEKREAEAALDQQPKTYPPRSWVWY